VKEIVVVKIGYDGIVLANSKKGQDGMKDIVAQTLLFAMVIF